MVLCKPKGLFGLRAALAAAVWAVAAVPAGAEGDWEVTPQSEQALARGLEWLVAQQGPEGNWTSNDLGLVATGMLAFLADGHAPGRGRYGQVLDRALEYILRHEKPSGLLNIADPQRDMYNHGLATFVLGQAHGMTSDPRITAVLDRALRLIAHTQCEDGGWDYRAQRQKNGHDLSLAVMQAKALRSAVDSGLQVPPEVIEMAIRSVRQHHCPQDGRRDAPEADQRRQPGQFTYTRWGGGGTVAMAAAGVVCLQEFGRYDDWRIPKNMQVITAAIEHQRGGGDGSGQLPFDPYTLYYVGQALYQVGGDDWRRHFPQLRDAVLRAQIVRPQERDSHGMWRASGHVGGRPGDLYATAVACFILAMPNRYLPILQEGRIESLSGRDAAQ